MFYGTVQGPPPQHVPPPQYRFATDIDLHAGPYRDEVVAEMVLPEAGELGIFFAVHNLNTASLAFTLRGPGDFSTPLLRGEGYQATDETSRWSQDVPAGTYRLVLNADRSPGTVDVYIRSQ